jgi:predicted lipoprotein with Yx(FWY)xxD motif
MKHHVSQSRTTHFVDGPAWLAASLLASFVAIGCGSSGGPSASNPAASGPNINLASNASLGNYLVSATGKTLYHFALDVPGTSSLAPVSNCATADGCLGAWPLLQVETPMVAQGLQSSDFSGFTRADGASQTAFQGWPLYTFAGDAQAGDTNGDNFEGVWFVVRDPFYSVLVMTQESYSALVTAKSVDATLYLADPHGRTLYTFADDTVGSSAVPPVSACTGTCLTLWPIFLADGTVTPTGIDSTKLTSFTRADGNMQSAFDGHPLYYFTSDTVPGDVTGQGVMDFFTAAPIL